jgi:redox-sensitive bicupin YhaK (pirin superfamily)
MGAMRRVFRVLTSLPTVEGAGVRLRRVFGHAETGLTDPFLMLDDFRGERPEDYRAGFPWHPHRGIETVTLVLAGRVEHRDSLGNHGVIGPGQVQWMTGGSGIMHEEMPAGDPDGRMGGLQLWVNLPARRKMMAPRYRDVSAESIPTVELPGGGTVRVVAGHLGATEGPVRGIVTEPTLLDVTLPAHGALSIGVTDGFTALAYVLDGRLAAEAGGEGVPRLSGVLWERAGDTLALTGGPDGAHVLVVSGRPLGEPIAWYGPIVMNTQAELQTALRDLREGTFVRDDAAGDDDTPDEND